MNYYSPTEFLKAAELGEVSMIDAEHIVSLLPQAREQTIAAGYYEPFHDIIREVCGHFETTPEKVLSNANSERERFVRMTVSRIFVDMGLSVYQSAKLLNKQFVSVQGYMRKFENEKITNKFYRSYWYSIQKKC